MCRQEQISKAYTQEFIFASENDQLIIKKKLKKEIFSIIFFSVS